jgi:hypothetical protein
LLKESLHGEAINADVVLLSIVCKASFKAYKPEDSIFSIREEKIIEVFISVFEFSGVP